ncbi:hypothetical protein ABMC89_04440 [Sulfitobacter sp. HNIBRBA3233]|uniref:hypothetical protein n=1 Tax=Sulfitobacter marinivivus TaxID=3158558 RepID=UPI0032DE99FA
MEAYVGTGKTNGSKIREVFIRRPIDSAVAAKVRNEGPHSSISMDGEGPLGAVRYLCYSVDTGRRAVVRCAQIKDQLCGTLQTFAARAPMAASVFLDKKRQAGEAPKKLY